MGTSGKAELCGLSTWNSQVDPSVVCAEWRERGTFALYLIYENSVNARIASTIASFVSLSHTPHFFSKHTEYKTPPLPCALWALRYHTTCDLGLWIP